MPKPNLPAPLAPRPEPGGQLLEAVRQRQPQHSQRLALQWVHRRGVLDLQRFCRTELSASLGPEAAAWLQDLLALDAPIPAGAAVLASSPQGAEPGAAAPLAPLNAANGSQSERRAVAQAPSEGLLEPASITETERPGGEPTPQPSPACSGLPRFQDPELQSRAMAAVDEAFAALAQTFQNEAGIPAAAADPVALPLSFSIEPAGFAPAATQTEAAPQPIPIRVGLWPSLRASAANLGAALRPPGGGRPNRLPASSTGLAESVLVEAQVPLHSAISAGESEAAAAEPLQEDRAKTAGRLSNLASDTLDAAGGEDVAAPADGPTADASDPGATAEAIQEEAAAHGGLLHRLGGRLQRRRLPRLSRLRAVVRDCVEETVALLRTPEPHFSDVEDFDTPQSQEVPRPVSQQSPASWAIESFVPAAPSPAAASIEAPEPAAWKPHTVAEVRPAPAPADRAAPATAMPASAAAPLSPLRPAPAASKPAVGSKRPAPAPAGLSDLRAWLPDRGDLPRAS